MPLRSSFKGGWPSASPAGERVAVAGAGWGACPLACVLLWFGEEPCVMLERDSTSVVIAARITSTIEPAVKILLRRRLRRAAARARRERELCARNGELLMRAFSFPWRIAQRADDSNSQQHEDEG